MMSRVCRYDAMTTIYCVKAGKTCTVFFPIQLQTAQMYTVGTVSKNVRFYNHNEKVCVHMTSKLLALKNTSIEFFICNSIEC